MNSSNLEDAEYSSHWFWAMWAQGAFGTEIIAESGIL